jgi:membrane-bound serine protease (ClpP class)
VSLYSIVSLLLFGCLLLFIEALVPGGIIGVAGLICLAAAVIATGMTYGLSVALPLGVGCSIGCMVLFLLWARYFPNSKMGLRFNLTTQIGKAAGYTSQDASLSRLVGRNGVAVSDLRPSGTVRIDGHRFDVVTEGGYVEAGETVTVTEVSSNRIVVRPTPASAPEPKRAEV